MKQSGPGILVLMILSLGTAGAQSVLFDFNGGPLHAPLPLDQVSGGVAAHFSATGDGFSIQEANALGFTPPGFSGYILYPSSVFLADLLVRFDQPVTAFSILYACQELACDDAATMRVTAYRNGTFVGTNTKTATHPGTYPVDTLGCIFPAGFDSVVVHYDSRPPTCQDYGPIFLADDMTVTPLGPTPVHGGAREIPGSFFLGNAYPSPFNSETTIRYRLPRESRVRLEIHDALGRRVEDLVDATEPPGLRSVTWNAAGLPSGVYYFRLTAVPTDDPRAVSSGMGKTLLVR